MVDQLIEAVIANNKQETLTLLNKGINPNAAVDRAQITPLHFAAQMNALDVIPALINAGAKIDAADYDEESTPLEVAKMNGNYEAVNLMLSFTNHKGMRTFH